MNVSFALVTLNEKSVSEVNVVRFNELVISETEKLWRVLRFKLFLFK